MSRLLLMLLVLFAGGTLAAENEDEIADYYIDFAVPDLSAAKLLGSAQEVTRPATPKELAGTILNATSGGNSIGSGFALEWAPAKTFLKNTVSREEYKKTVPIRRLSISAASVSDSANSRFAFGIGWVAFDKGDIILNDDFHAKLSNYLLARAEKLNQEWDEYASKRTSDFLFVDSSSALKIFTDPTDQSFMTFLNTAPSDTSSDARTLRERTFELFRKHGKAAFNQADSVAIEDIVDAYLSNVHLWRVSRLPESELTRRADSILADFKNKYWNASAVKLGIGYVAKSGDFTWGGLKHEKISGFLSGSRALRSWGQAIIQVKVDGVVDSSAVTWDYSLAGRGLAGTSEVRFSLDAALGHDGSAGDDERWSMKLVPGLEFKVNTGMWVEFALGLEAPIKELREPGILSQANFKYAFSEKQRFVRGN